MSFVRGLVAITFGFFLIASIFTFILMITQEAIGDPIIGNFSSVGQDLLSNATHIAQIQTIEDSYQDAKFDYDNLFILMWFFVEMGIIGMALVAPKLPAWDYLSLLFFGTIMISFAYSFIMDLTGWFISGFILTPFTPDVTDMPFFSFYQSFEIQIVILNLVGALVINNLFGKNGIINKNALLGG